jgi:hypothetical protein
MQREVQLQIDRVPQDRRKHTPKKAQKDDQPHFRITAPVIIYEDEKCIYVHENHLRLRQFPQLK